MRLAIPLLTAALAAALASAATSAPALAQGPIPYPNDADWESYPGGVTTGGAFVDLDRDGDQDLVVANGNDIYRQRVEVYSNDGDGNFPANPQWTSGDVDYHGHLAVGDVDGDGWPDVAVSVFLGASGFGDLGHVKLYRNLGGTLESTPSWRSADEFYTFSCTFGDADADGDLDLAVATGEPYYGAPAQNRIYYNQNGTLDANPGWLSAAADHTMDAAFADADGDGDLDLAFATAKGPTRVFFQSAGAISTTPGFVATDNNNQNGNTCTWADVDGDGYPELAVSDNDQLSGGSGDFKLYDNIGGTLQSTPMWSPFGGYVSSIAFADLHLDGAPEPAGGLWWGGAWIYRNDAGTLSTARDWESTKNSVSEAIFFGDLDGGGLVDETVALPANGGRAYDLGHLWLHAVENVRVDGVPLAAGDWCTDLQAGWLALNVTPTIGVQADVTYSETLDLGMTNWDTSVGNQIWRRDALVEVTATPTGSTTLYPGDSLDVRVDFTGTTARTEQIKVGIVAFPPQGSYFLLDRSAETLAPFGTQTRTHSFPVPAKVPSSLKGNWELLVAVFQGAVGPSTISAEDRIPFTIL